MIWTQSRSRLLGHSGAIYFVPRVAAIAKKEKSSKKERKGLWKMPSLWKSANSADSHRDLEKPSAFPHFPQALLGYTFMVEGIHLRSVENWS
jgi:hypothetical protein